MRNYESEAAALRGLKPSTKVLALVLSARMNDRNDDWPGRPVCWPGLDTLAEDADLKERAVRYAIDELVEAKVIRVYRERRPGTRWCHNVYEWTAPISPNYHPDWMKRPDTKNEAVGARLSKEGWEYCEQNHTGPHAAAAEHPEFILPAEQPTLIDSPSPEDDSQLPIEAEELAPKPHKKATKAAKKPKAHVIPEDWKPSEKTLATIRKQYPSLPIDIELRKFVTYWRDRGTRRPGWDRSWERWCANGNGFVNGAWTQPPALGATQGAPVINPNTGEAVTKEDFWYACEAHGIDPRPYVNFWKPIMGIPGDTGWGEWQTYLDRHTGRA